MGWGRTQKPGTTRRFIGVNHCFSSPEFGLQRELNSTGLDIAGYRVASTFVPVGARPL